MTQLGFGDLLAEADEANTQRKFDQATAQVEWAHAVYVVGRSESRRRRLSSISTPLRRRSSTARPR